MRDFKTTGTELQIRLFGGLIGSFEYRDLLRIYRSLLQMYKALSVQIQVLCGYTGLLCRFVGLLCGSCESLLRICKALCVEIQVFCADFLCKSTDSMATTPAKEPYRRDYILQKSPIKEMIQVFCADFFLKIYRLHGNNTLEHILILISTYT